VSFVAPGMDLPSVQGFEAVGTLRRPSGRARRFPRTRHVITNLSVNVASDGAVAHARSY